MCGLLTLAQGSCHLPGGSGARENQLGAGIPHPRSAGRIEDT